MLISFTREKALQKTAVRELLKIALLKMNIDSFELKKDKFGKPYLVLENGENLFVSLSHSQNSAVCAVKKEKVGVDIEKIRIVNEKIPRRFFSEIDYQYIINSKNKKEDVILLWSLRESLFKAVDNVDFLSFSRSVSFTDGKNKIKNKITFLGDEFEVSYDFFDNLVLTQAVVGEREKIFFI